MPTLEETVEAEGAGGATVEVEVRPPDAEGAEANGGPTAELVEPGEQAALIDRSAYEREDLAIAKVDGNQVDRLQLSFSGSIMLDRSDPADVALWNRLRLGVGELGLRIEGRCSATGAKQATDRGGELDVIVGAKTLKVTTVYVPAIGDDDHELEGGHGRTSAVPEEGE